MTVPFKIVEREGEPFKIVLQGADLLAPIVAEAKAARDAVKPLYGEGPPDPLLGIDGSVYYDTTDPFQLVMYGPKTEAGWGAGRSLKGEPGAAGNVAASLAQLKAAALANNTMLWGGVPFLWETEGAPYTSDEDQPFITTVESDHASLSVGAWRRQEAASIRTASGQQVETRLTPFNTPASLGGEPATTIGVDENVVTGSYGAFSDNVSYARPAWSALGPDPSVSGNKLGLAGLQMSNSVKSAIVIGGRDDYYSAIDEEATLSLTYNGDNITTHLAGINLGFHTDLIHGLATDGVTPKGSHGGIFGGSFQQVAGDYSWSGGGTVKQVFALQSAALGGKNILIGSLANVDAVRRSGVLAGLSITLSAGFQSVVLGGQTVTLSGDNSFSLGGQGVTVNGNRTGVIAGLNAEASAAGAVVIGGIGGKADLSGAMVRSSGPFAANGDSQTYFVEARRQTAGPAVFLSRDGGSGTDIFTPAANTTGVASFDIVVQEMGSSSKMAAYQLIFSYSNVGAALSIKGQNLVVVSEDDAAFNCVASIQGGGTRLAIGITTPDAGTYRATATGRVVVNKVA